jgi:hypothetical protein
VWLGLLRPIGELLRRVSEWFQARILDMNSHALRQPASAVMLTVAQQAHVARQPRKQRASSRGEWLAKTAPITAVTGRDAFYLAEFLLGWTRTVQGIKRLASRFNTKRADHIYQGSHEVDRQISCHGLYHSSSRHYKLDSSPRGR